MVIISATGDTRKLYVCLHGIRMHGHILREVTYTSHGETEPMHVLAELV